MALPSDALPHESGRNPAAAFGSMSAVVSIARLGGRAPLEPLRAAAAQQLSSTNPHEPPRASPPALMQRPATPGIVVAAVVGIPRGMQGSGGSNPLSSTTRNSQVNRPVASSLSTPPPPLIRARGTPGDGGHRLAHRHRPDARVARSGRGRRPGRRPGTGRTPRGVGPPPDPAAHDLGVHRALRGTDLALGIDRDQPLTLGRLQDAFQDHPEGGPASRYSAQVAAMCLFVVAVGHTLVSPKADTNPVVGGIPQVLVPPVPGGTFVPERRRRRRRHHSSPHPTSSVFPRRR
jgi:hypothetical protein